MFNIRELFKQVAAAGSAAFAAVLPIIAGLASAFKLDISAGKQAVIAAASAGGAALLGAAGNFIKQLIQRGRGVFDISEDAALVAIAKARQFLDEAASHLV